MVKDPRIPDFDELRNLYQKDPAAFEKRARELIQAQIQNARPEMQQRLRQLQFRIDAILSHYKDPIARYNKMVELFWTGVEELQRATEGKRPQASRKFPGRVISFRKSDT